MAVCLLIAVAAPCSGAPHSKTEIDWKNRSDAIWRAARESAKPILVEVWADWCPPCRRMDREVWSDPRVVAAARKFFAVSVDAGRASFLIDDELVYGSHQNYRVNVLPTILLLDPWREVLLLSEGYIHTGELLKILAEIPADYSSVRRQREALLANRDNSRALAQVGELYQLSTAFGIANRYFREALKSSGAKEDPALREDLLFGIATNEIRRADWAAARKALKRFRSDFPTSSRSDQAELGLVMADLAQRKASAARIWVESMRTRYPQSKAVATAEQLVGTAKK